MEINPKTDITIYEGTQEWSSLYLRGKLHTVGDTYLIWEALTQILEIPNEQSDDFLRGGYARTDVASTLDEIEVYRDEKFDLETRADELEAHARELEDEAEQLRREAEEIRDNAV